MLALWFHDLCSCGTREVCFFLHNSLAKRHVSALVPNRIHFWRKPRGGIVEIHEFVDVRDRGGPWSPDGWQCSLIATRRMPSLRLITDIYKKKPSYMQSHLFSSQWNCYTTNNTTLKNQTATNPKIGQIHNCIVVSSRKRISRSSIKTYETLGTNRFCQFFHTSNILVGLHSFCNTLFSFFLHSLLSRPNMSSFSFSFLLAKSPVSHHHNVSAQNIWSRFWTQSSTQTRHHVVPNHTRRTLLLSSV